MQKKKTTKATKTAKKAPSKTAKKVVKKPVKVESPPLPPVSSTVFLTPPTVKTEAEKIWEEIKNRPIEMFALPNQIVAQHCTPIPVEPSKLYLTIRSTATLPSLETALGNGFTVELVDKFVIVARAVPALVARKQ